MKLQFQQLLKATSKQREYIEILTNDLMLSTNSRNAHINNIIGRNIKYLDDLTALEASKVINKFKEYKDNRKQV